jgi:o-succinylbenzoate synthase
MILSGSVQFYPLPFKTPAGTSRGYMTIKKSWFITLSYAGKQGIGEVSIIEGLCQEYENQSSFEEQIERLLQIFLDIQQKSIQQLPIEGCNFPYQHIDNWARFPSILFALETAWQDLRNGGIRRYFDNSFTRGVMPIPINGLIWMGDRSYMQSQIEKKLSEGYSTLKMKIGSIGIEDELQLLRNIRKRHTPETLTLRVDANGAFTSEEVVPILEELGSLSIHSIEQPIGTNKWDEMAELCRKSVIPIGLDEELIGIFTKDRKTQLLHSIQPHYIILKPSLHGGIQGCREWISLAEERNIGWWMTSALESNVGLTAIAQFCGEFETTIPQGLGTGSLYTNNTSSTMFLRNGQLHNEVT